MKKIKLSLASIIIAEIYYKRKRVDITEKLICWRVEDPVSLSYRRCFIADTDHYCR